MKIILCALIFLYSSMSSAAPSPYAMQGKGVTHGSKNNLHIEGWSFIDSRGTYDLKNEVIKLNFIMKHKTTVPENYRGIITVKGAITIYNRSSEDKFTITSCNVNSGHDMCEWFLGNNMDRVIDVYGDATATFTLKNDAPFAITLFTLRSSCGQCDPLPIPTENNTEDKYSQPICYKTNPKSCPPNTSSIYELPDL